MTSPLHETFRHFPLTPLRLRLDGKLAASFDTQIESRISGSAVKGIEGKLKGLGFKLVMAPLVAYVEGKMNESRLKKGELEKTRNWAQEVAKVLSK